jgi:hypothetical protein
MAAGAWKFYKTFKRYMADGTLDLDAGIFRTTLHTPAANVGTNTLSIYNQLNNEIVSGNGYSTSGKTCSAHTWSTGASAGVMRFDCADIFWSANGGAIPASGSNIQFQAIWASAAASSGRKLVCYSTLTTGNFNVTDTNRFTTQINVNGVFELT